jgi:hypothetical protein
LKFPFLARAAVKRRAVFFLDHRAAHSSIITNKEAHRARYEIRINRFHHRKRTEAADADARLSFG